MDKSEKRSISQAIKMGLPCAQSEWAGCILWVSGANNGCVGLEEIAHLNAVIGRRAEIVSFENEGSLTLKVDCRNLLSKILDFLTRSNDFVNTNPFERRSK
jgi:hypothetical protein